MGGEGTCRDAQCRTVPAVPYSHQFGCRVQKENKKQIEKQMIEIILANDVELDVETLEEIRSKGMKPIGHLIGDWCVKSISSTRRVTLIDKMAFAEKAAEE